MDVSPLWACLAVLALLVLVGLGYVVWVVAVLAGWWPNQRGGGRR